MIRVRDLWHDESWDLPDEEAAWRWAQEHLPHVMEENPKDFDNLLTLVNDHQNYEMVRLDHPEEDVQVPGVMGVFRAAKLLREGRDYEDPAWRAALVVHGEDPHAAALAASGVEPSQDNLAALKGLLEATEARPVKHGMLVKGEGDDEGEHNPKAAFHHTGTPPALAEHPLFHPAMTSGLISGEAPRAASAPGGHDALVRDLTSMGLRHEETQGFYGGPERSVIVHGPTQQQMYDLGKKYGQESVVWGQGGKHRLLYTTGENAGQYHPAKNVVRHSPEPPNDYYTTLPGMGHVTLYFDFDKKLPAGELTKAEDRGMFTVRHEGREMVVMGVAKHGLLVSERPRKPEGLTDALVCPDAPQGEVQAPVSEGQETADAVKQALEAGKVHRMKLGGKHSLGSILVEDPESGQKLLLKPGSGRQSPAAGAAEEPASQSRREAAFWHALQAMGISAWAPRSDLVTIGGAEYAAERWLGDGWKPVAEAYQEDPARVQHQLVPYLQDGTLHRLAAADYLLGNSDRHGKNVLWKDGQMQLIDHGSALAGYGFDPGGDPQQTFTPWYLRLWAGESYASLGSEEKGAKLPKLGTWADESLRAWLGGLDAGGISAVLARYGVMVGPTEQRLRILRAWANAHGASTAVCEAWANPMFTDGP